MSYFVYLITSKDKKKTISYVGYTNNLDKRIKLHNSNRGAKFTKGRKWKIIYSERLSTKKEAMKREYYIKKNRIFRNLIKKEYLKKLKQ